MEIPRCRASLKSLRGKREVLIEFYDAPFESLYIFHFPSSVLLESSTSHGSNDVYVFFNFSSVFVL